MSVPTWPRHIEKWSLHPKRIVDRHRRAYNPSDLRKRWAQRMTVALGYRCFDGLVLCADSEWTHGQSHKTHGTKVAHVQVPKAGFYFAMAGTGSYLFMEKVFDEYADTVQSQPPPTLADARARFDAKLKEIYKKEIFSIPHWESLDMDAKFLLGIRAGGSLAFLSTDTHMLGDAPDTECIGSGGEAASLVSKIMFRPALTRYEAALIAVYVLWLVKSTSVGAGGESSILMLDANEDGLWEKRFDDITVIEQRLERFSNIWASIALNWANLSLTQQQYQDRVEEFRKRLAAVRDDFRKQYESSGLTLRELIDFLGGPAHKDDAGQG